MHGFVGLGYDPNMTKARFAAMEDEKQGDMEAMLNFCLGINRSNKLTLESIRQKSGWLLAGADDIYILGPPDVPFKEVKLHEERLKLIGLEPNYSKMKCFIDEEHRNKTYHQAREATGIAEGTVENENGETFYGVKAYGVPIGTKEYIAHWLELKSKKIIPNLRKISDTLDPNAIIPVEIPTRQCLWLLILTCLQFKGNYFVRHIPPQFTESLCDQIDSEISVVYARILYSEKRCRFGIGRLVEFHKLELVFLSQLVFYTHT